MDIWPLRLTCPNCLGLQQLAVLSPPPSAGGNHSVSGHVYTSAQSEEASLHQQRHAKKVYLAAACRKSSRTANFPQYLSTRLDPEELPVESPGYFYPDYSTLASRVPKSEPFTPEPKLSLRFDASGTRSGRHRIDTNLKVFIASASVKESQSK
jgi:hypothetical protein